MTFEELFIQVRYEVGPEDDVEVLLMMVEEGLNAYFHSDPAWKTERINQFPAEPIYCEIVAAIGEGVQQAGDAFSNELLVKATAVAEGFRCIINRVRRLHLVCREIKVSK